MQTTLGFLLSNKIPCADDCRFNWSCVGEAKGCPIDGRHEYNSTQKSIREIELEIKDKLDKIDELKKEIKDDEEALLECLEDELDLEPEPGEEVIFDCSGPSLEEDLSWARAENEPEIRLFELQVGELKAKLEHLKKGGK